MGRTGKRVGGKDGSRYQEVRDRDRETENTHTHMGNSQVSRYLEAMMLNVCILPSCNELFFFSIRTST